MNAKKIITGVLIVTALGGGIWAMRKNQGSLNATAHARTEQKIKGPAEAAVKIVEYSDFECPACQKAQVEIKRIFDAFGPQVNLTFRHFPLDSHRWSGLAHQAAECASRQGHFWEYHDRLFSEQLIWPKTINPYEDFMRYAGELNLDLQTFGACLADPQVREDILKEKTEGKELLITGTPTFFINGERLVGPVELQARADEIIRRELGLTAPDAPPALPGPENP